MNFNFNELKAHVHHTVHTLLLWVHKAMIKL